MHLLITGGTVFFSRFAAEYFIRAGHAVTVLNRGSRPQPEGAEALLCDRRQPGDILRGRHFDAVLDITAYEPADIGGLLSSGVTFDDYVMISSSAVYPETNPQPFTEEQTCGRNAYWGDYGTNKLAAERLLREQVPRAYILRPPYLYGLYENLYRAAFVFDCAVQNRPFWLPGDGSLPLQFFHVRDACRLTEILLRQHPDERLLNVGNPAPVSVREWVTLCYLAVGTEPVFRQAPTDVPLWKYFCFRDYAYRLDVTRQARWLTDLTPMEQGLREQWEWYRLHTDGISNRKPFLEFIDTHFRGSC